MQAHVIISYDGTDNDHDALALGRIFGDAGARVSLAYVRHAAESDPSAEIASQAKAEGERVVVVVGAVVGDDYVRLHGVIPVQEFRSRLPAP